ncbi:MAG: GNAT family N-acetyltransferase [Chloroflexi bacterium]|nr:GNAT family N-acetyltransferase [Chloroflexota bacterium]
MRLAQKDDLEALYRCDDVAQRDQSRRDAVARAVAEGQCYVAVNDRVLGYGVLEYTFFAQGFVALVIVQPNYRRQGVGSALLRHFGVVCRTDKLFTSTNLSNSPMQLLLAKLGYKLSGVIHDLDEGDPELVYVKYLTPRLAVDKRLNMELNHE